MAGLAEMAIGIATVLQTSSKPEPLPVTVRGETVDGGATLVRAVIHECSDAGIRLHKVTVDPELFRFLTSGGTMTKYMDVSIEADATLGAELCFFRHAIT